MNNQVTVALMVLAISSMCLVWGRPIDSDAGEKDKDDVQERKLFFDPTADTDFQVKVGDITYFTESYWELLNEKLGSNRGSSHGKDKRAAVRDKRRLWPDGRIYYRLDDLYYTESNKQVILQAMAHWEEHTCIRFVQRTNEVDHLFIYPGPGCSSFVGRTAYEQRVSIGPSCFSFKSALHELGHAIGFHHEHNRPDRDEHINIIKENILPGYGARSQFEKKTEAEVDSLGIGYDYNSIMHYDRNILSRKHYLNTIVAKDPSIIVGEAVVLSPLDILQTNLLYGCSNSTKDHPPRTTIIPDLLVTSEPEPIPSHEFACGGVFDGQMQGSFTSPGFGTYPHNTDCEWSIRVPEGYYIKLTADLFMEYSSGCTKDYLLIHDTLDQSTYRLARWCYSDYEGIVAYTLANTAYIRFHTDGSNRNAGAKGFQLTFEAADIDECQSNDYCSHNCENLPGSYECSCPRGFYLSADQKHCFDTNECAINKGGCDHKCVNRGGSFHCECDSGYRLLSDGKTCIDDSVVVDPCQQANCEHDCVVIGGTAAMCLCPKGYVISSADGVSCVDDNECLKNNGGCEALCTNSEGSFECSCHQGYTLAYDGLACEDVNECTSNNHGCSDGCTNTIGSYYCTCGEGLELQADGLSCARPSAPITLQDSQGSLHTPNWPETYPVNTDVEWIISCPNPEQYIHFTFESPFSIDCPSDWLEVYSGEYGTENLFRKFCDTETPNPFVVMLYRAFIKFHAGSEHQVTNKGFKLSYQCIGSVISSHIVPDKIVEPEPLQIIITEATTQAPTTTEATTQAPTTTEATTLALTTIEATTLAPTTTEATTQAPTTTEATTQASTTTEATTLAPTTTEATTQSPTTTEATTPAPTTTEATTTVVEATTQALPSNVLTASSGFIKSPNWPRTYPVNIDLEWFIRCPAPAHSVRISLRNRPFWIGGQQYQGCPKDWVKVFAGKTDQGRQYGPYCYKYPPRVFVIPSMYAVVKFHAGPKHHPTRTGFKLTYDCIS